MAGSDTGCGQQHGQLCVWVFTQGTEKDGKVATTFAAHKYDSFYVVH